MPSSTTWKRTCAPCEPLILFSAALAGCELAAPGEPMRLDLITIAPGAELVSSMGHTSIVFSGGPLDRPRVFDWADANSARPEQVLRGEFQVQLHARDVPRTFMAVLDPTRTRNLTTIEAPPADVERLWAELEDQASHSQRYPYHWATGNCATHARDAIDRAVPGGFRDDGPARTTARYEGGRHLWGWPVLGFAWRFTTSAMLDEPLSRWERMMLPEHLMLGVPARATCTLQGEHGWAPPTPPPAWPWVLPGAAGSLGVITAMARGHRRAVAVLVGIYGVLLASLGSVSMALWAISTFEGVGPTENWLIAGPQTWALVWGAWRIDRGQPIPRWLPASLVALALLGLLPFLPQANEDIQAALLPGLCVCCAALAALGRAP